MTPRKPVRVQYVPSEPNGNGNGTLLNQFSKYGLPGLVIAVLFFFVWHNMNTSNKVIEKNTEAMSEFNGAVREMKDALKDNTHSLNQFREERRRRGP